MSVAVQFYSWKGVVLHVLVLNFFEEFTHNCEANLPKCVTLCVAFFGLSDEISNASEVPDDFDYVLTAEQWDGVLEAVRNQDQDQLKSQLQKLDDEVQKQKLVNFLVEMFSTFVLFFMHYIMENINCRECHVLALFVSTHLTVPNIL